MFEGLFDIKNDRRLSIYLYRSGLLFWALYLLTGSPAFFTFATYRNPIGLLSGLLITLAFCAHMAYESMHHKASYQQKMKWLFIGTVFASVLIYVMEFGAPSLPEVWLQVLNRLE